MEITKELLQSQLDTLKKNQDGFLQGYVQALSWVASVLETKETEVKQAEVVK